jgi:hypothetical protein
MKYQNYLFFCAASISWAWLEPANATTVLPVLPNAIVEVFDQTVTTTPYDTTNNQTAVTPGNFEAYSPAGTTFQVSTQVNGVTTQTLVTTSNPAAISVGGGGNVAASSIRGMPSPTVSAMVASPTFGGTGKTDLSYFFQVVAPAGYSGPTTTNITVNAIGSVSAATSSAGQSASSLAQLVIPGTSLNDLVNANYFVSNGNSVPRSSVQGAGFISSTTVSPSGSLVTGGFDESGSYAVTIGTTYEVELTANVGICSGTGDACSASIDPTITVGSGLLMDFSPGIGDTVSAVPEPSTWAMIALGFIGIGALGRRRRQNNAALS